MDIVGKRYAFLLVEDQKDTDGGYIPCIAVENEPGYYPMTGQGVGASPWNWGVDKEIAQQLCDEKNSRLGLDKEDSYRIIASSMKNV